MPTFDEVMADINASPQDADTDESNLDGTLDEGDDSGLDTEGDADNSDETGLEPAFDPNTLTDPVLLQQYKQMQAAFTPKLQEAAQLRQQYAGIDQSVLDAAREYQNLLQTDPYQARQFLAQQQAYIDQQLGVQQPADPFEGVEPLTDSEAALLSAGRQMWQFIQQQQLQNQQYQFQAQREATERSFSQLEAQFKTTIPLEDKQRVQQMCQQTGCSDVALMWKALNFEQAEKRGADKASRTAQKKTKAPTPPTNRQQRGTAPVASGKRGLEGAFEDAWNQHNSG